MVFINSPINFSPPLRMTINVPPIMTPFLPIVILNERKNAFVGKMGNSNMTPSEESMTRIIK